MRALKRKAGSQRGASITFALLLFLVCAVISGVVIVAATTAAGRMSQQAEMDERYYAVTAVAGKLKSLFEGNDKEIKLLYTKADKPENITNITITSPTDIDASGILATASKGVLKKTATTISISGDKIENADKTVECDVTGALSNDGTLVFTITATSKKDETATGTYGLRLTFASNLQLHASDSSETTATATVEWKMLRAEKVRSDRTKPTEG